MREFSLVKVNKINDNLDARYRDFLEILSSYGENNHEFYDIGLNSERDIILDEEGGDIVVLNSLEGLVQRVSLFLKTQLGTLPSDASWGTVLENLVGKNNVDIRLLAYRLKRDLEKLEGIDFVDDVSVKTARKDDYKIVILDITVKPVGFDFKLKFIFAAE